MNLNKLAAIIAPGELRIPKGGTDTSLNIGMSIVFATAGAVALLIIVIAGLRMVLSQGNPESVSKARNTIIYAAIGLAVCVLGFSIVTFVLNNV